MFELKNRQLYINGLFDISDNYCSLINDNAIDLLYTGTNKFGSKILGSILFEDDENLYYQKFETVNVLSMNQISFGDVLYLRKKF